MLDDSTCNTDQRVAVNVFVVVAAADANVLFDIAHVAVHLSILVIDV